MYTETFLINESTLGKRAEYLSIYNPDLLLPIPRAEKRTEIGIDNQQLPFYGFDVWNHYEVSWLNEKGKPVVAIAEIVYDCTSPFLIESKSLKLYFNSFNNSSFQNRAQLELIIKNDLEARIKSAVYVKIYALQEMKTVQISTHLKGSCIDDLDIPCSVYTVDTSFLKVNNQIVEESLHSHLLKSNCLVTRQPDWGSVEITYKGNQINRAGLLQYIVSFRNHNEFHEQCIERIFMDIKKYCNPESLTVYGRYTRRGGLDINPLRSTEKLDYAGNNERLIRQ